MVGLVVLGDRDKFSWRKDMRRESGNRFIVVLSHPVRKYPFPTIVAEQFAMQHRTAHQIPSKGTVLFGVTPMVEIDPALVGQWGGKFIGVVGIAFGIVRGTRQFQAK